MSTLYLRLSASRRGWAPVPLRMPKGFKPNPPSCEGWQFSWTTEHEFSCQLTSQPPRRWEGEPAIASITVQFERACVPCLKHNIQIQHASCLHNHVRQCSGTWKWTNVLCWGGVFKNHILLQDVYSAAWVNHSHRNLFHPQELENSCQLQWKSPIHKGLHKIQVFLLLCLHLRGHKIKPNWWEWASGKCLCFFLSHLQNMHFAYSSDLAGQWLYPPSSTELLSSPSAFTLLQLEFQFSLSEESSLMPSRDGGGRFLPIFSRCRSAPNISNLFSSWSSLPCSLTHFPLSVFSHWAGQRVETACPAPGSPVSFMSSARHLFLTTLFLTATCLLLSK